MADKELRKNLELLLKKRKNLRSSVTKHVNAFPEAEAEAQEAKRLLLKKKQTELGKMDGDVIDLMVKMNYVDEALELESSEADTYQETILITLNTGRADQGAGNPRSTVKLPELKLPEFNLEPRNFTNFWTQFRRIDDDPNINKTDKFLYLIMHLKPGSAARKLVESFTIEENNYEKALAALKSRFGREDVIIDTLYRDMLKLVSSKPSLKELYEELNCKIRNLESVGLTTEQIAFIYPLVESCFPTDVLKIWERKKSEMKREEDKVGSTLSLGVRFSNFEPLLEFLESEVEMEEKLAKTRPKIHTPKEQNPSCNVTASALHAKTKTPQRTLKCSFCGFQHYNSDCPKAKDWSPQQLQEKVREAGLCWTCLSFTHRSKDCRAHVKCEHCGGRHTSLVCKTRVRPEKSTEKGKSDNSLHAGAVTGEEIFLKTLMVNVKCRGTVFSARALLDDGSSRSYITEAFAKKINLKPVGEEIMSHTLFGGVSTQPKTHKVYQVDLANPLTDEVCTVQLLNQNQICSTLPSVTNREVLNELAELNIQITDTKRGSAPPIDILLGSQALGKLFTGKIEPLHCGVTAIETKLGWTVLGAVNKKVSNMVNVCLLNQHLPTIWDLETLGIERGNSTQKSLEEDTEAFFRKTTQIKNDRFEVALPWVEGHPEIDDNKRTAEKRLHAVTAKLLKTQNFETYDAVFQEWEKEGFIEEVHEIEDTPSHYIPHRPVFSETKTTKTRPVFDASCKGSFGVSLNDCLSKGPNLLKEVPEILVRFRMHEMGVSADIRKAFQMISVREDDRNWLKFLWWKDGVNKECKIFRHSRVPFGLTCSPFILNAVLQMIFEQQTTTEMMEKLKDSFFMDDFVSSSPAVQLKELINEATNVLKKNGFDLRGWRYTGDIETKEAKVLGIKWNTKDDTLSVEVPTTKETGKMTKRTILSLVSRVYDPIGATSAAMIVPKLLLQEAWRRKLDWDEEVPDDLRKRFQKWSESLPHLGKINIPRRIHHGNEDMSCCEIHTFCDASKEKYAACVYLRCTHDDKTDVYLVAAKAKVGPIEPLTIPRMELLAATIAVRLTLSVKRAMKMNLKTHYWTDSMVVLGWITAETQWKVWVGNRVREIRENSDPTEWKHVPGQMNPADLPSRGCNFGELNESDFLNGPHWLKEGNWPTTKIICPEEALTEQKTSTVLFSNDEEPFSNTLLQYFSEYQRILRVVIYMLRFIAKCQKEECCSGPVTAKEVTQAETTIFKLVQKEWPLEKKNETMKQMQTLMDQDGLLKLRTKLLLGEGTQSDKFPVVLPKHPLVQALIYFKHKEAQHAGVQTTLNLLRDSVWIIRGRQIVRHVLNKCLACKRHKVKHAETEPAPLPNFRIKTGGVFETTGVDLAGPLFLKGDKKAWIVLYTCAVYRAVHLELVTSLSTESFIMSMRRFIARRTRPKRVVSDNGSNFLGTAGLFQTLNWDEIVAEFALQKIEWQFSPPLSPWFGGFWERLIGVCKSILKKTLGKAYLDYEEMLTVLCSCEQTVNSRPITYMYDDAEELMPITPAHFLSDIPSAEPHDLDSIDTKSLYRRVRYRQEIRDKLKKRFENDYIRWLVERSTHTKVSTLHPGEVVLIGNESKRTLWPLGKILKVFPGGRVAKVKTEKGEFIRPVKKLYPLEVRLSELEMEGNTDESKEDSPEKLNPLEVSELEHDRVESTDESPAASPEMCDELSSNFKIDEIVRTTRGRQVKPPLKLNL